MKVVVEFFDEKNINKYVHLSIYKYTYCKIQIKFKIYSLIKI